MSPRIRVLPDSLVNLIAAGEVVERPASIVKELLENSLDASSSRITVHLRDGGKREIRVTDNGTGMGREQALLSIERHATSKIAGPEDLLRITSLGFRGEALPSIAAVGKFSLQTWDGRGGTGNRISIDNGKLVSVQAGPAVKGTSVTLSSIFSRIPARRKFLKSADTEMAWCVRTVEEAALTRPDVHFEVTGPGGIHTVLPEVTSLRERVWTMWGDDTARRLMRIQAHTEDVMVDGFISPPDMTYSRRTRYHILVNGRPVRDPGLTRLITTALSTRYPSGRHPALVLSLQVLPGDVDVNVHPSKREIRLARPRSVSAALKEALNELSPLTVAHPYDTSQPRDSGSMPARDAPDAERGSAALPAAGVLEEKTPPTGQLSMERGTRVIGQALGTYIISEIDGRLAVVDQHAAHERIVYNRLMEAYGSTVRPSQRLMIPVLLQLGSAEATNLLRKRPLLEAFGFELEEFGDSVVRITALPAEIPQDLSKSVAESLASDLDEVSYVPEEIALHISRWACKQSIMAGKTLSMEDMENLLADLEIAESGFSCPHGRPTRIFLSEVELEKLFLRR